MIILTDLQEIMQCIFTFYTVFYKCNYLYRIIISILLYNLLPFIISFIFYYFNNIKIKEPILITPKSFFITSQKILYSCTDVLLLRLFLQLLYNSQ